MCRCATVIELRFIPTTQYFCSLIKCLNYVRQRIAFNHMMTSTIHDPFECVCVCVFEETFPICAVSIPLVQNFHRLLLFIRICVPFASRMPRFVLMRRAPVPFSARTHFHLLGTNPKKKTKTTQLENGKYSKSTQFCCVFPEDVRGKIISENFLCGEPLLYGVCPFHSIPVNVRWGIILALSQMTNT